MRVFASLIAWLSAAAVVLLAAWPSLSDQPFPLPAWGNAIRGPALTALAVATLGFAVWVSALWRHAREHQMVFAVLAMACFLCAALFVSVPVGIGFAALAVLVRSR